MCRMSSPRNKQMNKETREQMVMTTLKLTPETIGEHTKALPEEDATYYWNPVPGGLAMIVGKDGRKLLAPTCIGLERQLEEYIEGKRN